MSYINTLSAVEAKLLLESVKAHETELQAEIDFRADCITTSINADGYSDEAMEARVVYKSEIQQRKESLDKLFAMRLKLQKIIA